MKADSAYYNRGPVLSFTTSLRLPLQDLSYDVQNSANKKETLHLLQSVTGFIAPGEMTALVTALSRMSKTCSVVDFSTKS